MLIFYIVLVVPILLDLEIAQISSLVQILGYINNLVLTTTAVKLPKMFPEDWEKSRFRVPIPVFHALMVITCIAIHSHHGLRILLGILPLWQRQGKAHCIL